jgi:beta-galactosidase
VITRAYGRGRITYIGAVLDEKLVAAAMQWMAKTGEITAAFGPVPDGIEASRRVGTAGSVFVLINLSPEKQKVTLPQSMRSLLEVCDVTQVELRQYDLAVLFDQSKLRSP